ncbi:neutral alpha-glucosidase AB [Stomoxys calcitrans]|uniref:neutral alpha-glucosidase AB n=1 Tax=Stomoxys calcitrans TaxID=35570 RepID=UPI0027E27D43|nr:neutral alpha-glucosidase AB [Stomoxys calcitrans]XP_059223624.1 neutral alpha-glucosidase AB [Stomoxys calcitrans]
MRLAIFLLIFCICEYALGVDPTNFKTCEQSSFCRRSRKIQPGNSKFALVPGSMNTYSNSITADLINKDTHHLYVLKLEALVNNKFRLLIDEKTPLKPRYKVEHVLIGEPQSETLTVVKEDKSEIVLQSGSNKAVLFADPFRVDFYENEVLVVSANAKGLMNFEHLRPKPQKNSDGNPPEEEGGEAANAIPQTPEDSDPGAWEENFKSHHDSKPYGPEAIALDFSFPEAEVLFGIPEHADSFILKSTSGSDPYRLYNLDVFEYIIDSKMALYGSIPVLYGHGPKRTAGVYWQNAAETWVDIYLTEQNVVSSIVKLVSGSNKVDPPAAHFMSESGIIDAFILLGPKPMDTFKQYTALTGVAPLPQMFALAYHQCRWNYNDAKDVETVSANFDHYDIPMDIMWLDIEYTDGKKYFTWDQFKFPEPLSMIKNLTDLGRHLVIIIDPHIKRDGGYFFHNDCTENGYYVKTRDGKDYEGWCWPGSASYPDFFRQDVRDYYANQYLLSNFKTVTNDVMFWNDMNEPSVFNGPEVTMPKDMVHYGDWEHRDVHNLYGHMHIMGTFEGILRRDPKQRPFILTRAHFSGSQRYAAIWTGDNMADWGHLQHSIKMCLSEAVAGFSFCGADVGGFFGNPDAELFERWYQTGAFLPFFRSHAHIDTKRREPWLYPEKTRLVIRDAIRKRYSYLPLWYTMFYEHEMDGSPVIRPLLTHYPKDKEGYAIDNQLLLQDRILVRPVMQQGVSKVDVYFPALDEKRTVGDLWYDVDTFQKYDRVGRETIQVNDYKIPVYQRGGSIVPKKERIRRASTLMKNDPYTLIVCLDRKGKAEGTLYLDDEKSYDYRQGKFIHVNYSFDGGKLTNNFIKPPNYETKAWIERIVIAGLDRQPKSATITINGVTDKLDVSPFEKAFVIRKPGVGISKDFEIKLNY